jgi:hypothetical protein
VVGFVALGRNHGVYGVAAGLCVIAYLARRENVFRPLSGLIAWAAGLVIGYLPVLAMIAFAPGFADALWESIVVLFDLKAPTCHCRCRGHGSHRSMQTSRS